MTEELTTTQPEEPEDALGIGPEVDEHDIALTRKHPSRSLVFTLAAIALLMSSIDLTIVATALPAIRNGVHATINWAGWTITVYGLGLIVALPIGGKLSDQFGRRRVFTLAIATFTASSLACGMSRNVYMLIVFRAFQALGGGALQPSAVGLVADHFGKDRGRAIGMFGTFFASGQVVGPVLGGVLVDYLSWRWIFFVNVPIGTILILLVLGFIPSSSRLEVTPIDRKGVALLTGFILTAIFGIANFGNGHSTVYSVSFLFPELCAALLLVLFLRHTRSSQTPFIPMRLLSGRGFAAVNSISLLFGVTGFGVVSLLPLYAEERYHLSSVSAGTLLSARAVGMVAIGAIAALVLQRTGYRLPMFIGFTIVAGGTMMMSVSPRLGLQPYAWLSLCAGIAGFGTGLLNPAMSNSAFHLAPDEVAAISGLRGMFLNLGLIVSVSVTTAMLNRSNDPAIVQTRIFWVAAGLLMTLMMAIVSRVPEHRGSW